MVRLCFLYYVWHLGAFRCMENTPMVCADDLTSIRGIFKNDPKSRSVNNSLQRLDLDSSSVICFCCQPKLRSVDLVSKFCWWGLWALLTKSGRLLVCLNLPYQLMEVEPAGRLHNELDRRRTFCGYVDFPSVSVYCWFWGRVYI